MRKDPIVREIRKRREEHAALFNYDIKAIVQALKEEERRSGRIVVSFADNRQQTDKSNMLKRKRA